MQVLLRLFLFLTAILVPYAAGANDLVASRTSNVSSSAPAPAFVNDLQQANLFLDTGTYIARVIFSGFTNASGNVVSRLVQQEPGNAVAGVPLMLADILGPNGSFSKTIEQTFTVVSGVDTVFSWSTQARISSGSIQADFQLFKQVVPVPGPEAGVGLGALAMAGVAYLAMKRRRSIAA